jgi:hypothetical protein
MSVADTFEDNLGTWEVDSSNERFVRKDSEGEVNGEAPFAWVEEDTQGAPEWFKDKLAELNAE